MLLTAFFYKTLQRVPAVPLLHMTADAMVSAGVVLAGIAIIATGCLWFDPVVSLIIVAVEQICL